MQIKVNDWLHLTPSPPPHPSFLQMNLLLKEYLSSGDCEEAVRCLRELEVPHFHHELVYEAVVLVLEDGREETARSICSLLRYMAVTTIITQDQLNTVSIGCWIIA